MYYVVRPPCLMEDEGRTEMCGSFPTLEAARKAIDELSENDTGYFKRSDYKILQDGQMI